MKLDRPRPNKEQWRLWFDEDLRDGDITSNALIPETEHARARVISREAGIVCGSEYLEDIIEHLGLSVTIHELLPSGSQVETNQVIANFSGEYRKLLGLERLYLNLIQHLSGIATLTSRFVAAVGNRDAKILDTRKTKPGLRLLEKFAVLAGGGHNHRIGLFDEFLIKENHLAYFAESPNPFASAIETARASRPDTFLTIEVQNFEQCELALSGNPEVILLDNMSNEEMTRCVELKNTKQSKTLLESSGNMSLERVESVAACGVDRISIGALTHSAKNFDISMLVEQSGS